MQRVPTRLTAASPVITSLYTCHPRHTVGTCEWRLFLSTSDGSVVSPWHHIPRRPPGAAVDLLTYVNEIPRGSRAKMEMLKSEPFNPIAQDAWSEQPGKPLRYFTYGDMPFDYGFIPQTWENPAAVDANTGCRGDGDPVDVVQIRHGDLQIGGVHTVRVLGVLALIDQGETDWKIVTESVVPGVDGYGHISKVPEELQRTIVDWFRNYKTTDGKKPNEFAFGGVIRGAETALEVIDECAKQYATLFGGKASDHGYWIHDCV